MKRIDFAIKKEQFHFGMLMIFIGIIMPIHFNHENLEIYNLISKSLEKWDKEFIIVATFKIVFLNTIRAFPNYIAIFTIIDSITLKVNQKKLFFLKFLPIALVMPLIYFFIKIFFNIELTIGKSSILGLGWVYYYSRFNFKRTNIPKKSLGLLVFMMGIQWLDITSYFQILGTGELTSDLHKASEFMETTTILNILGLVFFILLTSFSILLLSIFKSQEKAMHIFEKELENRYMKEARYLVHDLKTPLFSIRTLVEVLKMQEENEKKIEYYSKIENSLDKTNLMISEILKTNLKTPVKISEIFDFIFSYLSTHNGISKIKYENYLSNDYIIQANRILLCRAIINLIINAYEVSKDKVEIVIKDYKKYFYIIIKDEGPGISDEDILRIYNDGFSTKNSTGLGLSFVNKVLEEHECKIFFKKGTDIGTKVYLKFLIGGKDGK
ncbi:HAMP domain-containing histidine kinase [Cetobacterium sp. 2A]|uniref:sensor histidine kinase n=1 Tax=unclassified Cetobacterium TaxID=2630983 RepID=UPI00163D2BA2|nr:HAMP domain-containing sensor histidine kinase [Cetobacterium sp. 2A]MBC2855021.1 HAMP domain-containing histidine kinase [Cetobacterium sp. 2A]